MKKAILLILTILFVLQIFCVLVWYAGCQKVLTDIIGRVGTLQITHTECEKRLAIEKAYGNKGITEAKALISLVQDAIENEVGRTFGITVTPKEIAAFSKHTDESTKAPEILAKIKEVFDDDTVAYERIYLAPKILNSKLRSWYSTDPNIHKAERTSIEKAYSLVHSGKSMEEATHECGLLFSTIEHERRDKLLPSALKRYFPDRKMGSPSDDPMIRVIESLSVGEMHQDIIENDHGYQILKLVKKEETKYTLVTITAQKRPFTKWFLEHAEKIPVKILDKELEKEVFSHYSNIWWVNKRCKK